MPRDALTPGAYPRKDKLVPIKGDDGMYRLSRIRHRTISGSYTRTSAQGRTIDECLQEFERQWAVNRRKGTVRRSSKHREKVMLKLTDKMGAAFKMFDDMQKAKAEKGKLKWYSYDSYHRSIYPSDSAFACPDAIKLEAELGSYTIGEIGRPAELHSYITDIADLSPSVAYRHHVILGMIFRELTLQGLFDVCPMTGVPAPDTTAANGQRALTADECAELPNVFGDAGSQPRGHDYVLPISLLLLGTGVRLGEGLAARWCDMPELDDPAVERAVFHVCGTIVKRDNMPPFRQDGRKCGVHSDYYIVMPKWLTAEMRVWKRVCNPASEDEHLCMSGDRIVYTALAHYALAVMREGTPLEWLCWGHLRDTVATEVAGRSGEKARASAQLGHSEGSSMATRHYIDKRGFKHHAVDNSQWLEYLNPQSGTKVTLLTRFPQAATG
jgi:hypothetical protein